MSVVSVVLDKLVWRKGCMTEDGNKNINNLLGVQERLRCCGVMRVITKVKVGERKESEMERGNGRRYN